MPSQGPNGPSSGTDDASIGSVAWTNPGNVTADDAVYATATASGLPKLTHYLTATGFGFSIPAGATINGIQVEWHRLSTVASGVVDNSVKIVKGGTVGGNEKATATVWSTSPSYDSYGGSSDLWGLTWAPSDINAGNFGAVLSASITSATAEVDFVRITVTYTPAGGSAALEEEGVTWQMGW